MNIFRMNKEFIVMSVFNVNFIVNFLIGTNCQGCDKKIIDKILKYK